MFLQWMSIFIHSFQFQRSSTALLLLLKIFFFFLHCNFPLYINSIYHLQTLHSDTKWNYIKIFFLLSEKYELKIWQRVDVVWEENHCIDLMLSQVEILSLLKIVKHFLFEWVKMKHKFCWLRFSHYHYIILHTANLCC